jgi:hypothetical protein
MPVLEISQEELGPHRGRATLVYIEAVMLWPDAPERRGRAFAAFDADRMKNAIPALDAPDDIAMLTHRQLHEILNFVSGAPRLSDIREDSQKAFVHGVACGLVVGEIIRRRDAGHARAQLGTVMDAAAAILTGAGGVPLSRKTLDAVWPRFRTVAHLWTAYLLTAATSGEPTFPCRLDKLADFLSVAEWYRIEGESFRPKQSDRPVLLADKTWRMPSDVPMIPARPF